MNATATSTANSEILFAIATYNEIENLPPLVEELLAIRPDADILVIDDNSPDGTGDWCDEFGAEEPRLYCLHRSGKLGLGSATVLAMEFAIEHHYKIVLTMDADFSHHPEHVPELLAPLLDPRTSVDVVIGSRYVPGGQISGWPRHRRVMSRCVNAYARLCLGLSVRDCSGAFRAYRCNILRRIDPDRIRSRGYSYLEEILWRLKCAGAEMVEIPIHFRDRTRGQTKINWREAVAALGQIFRFGLVNWIPFFPGKSPKSTG